MCERDAPSDGRQHHDRHPWARHRESPCPRFNLRNQCQGIDPHNHSDGNPVVVLDHDDNYLDVTNALSVFDEVTNRPPPLDHQPAMRLAEAQG